jgi:hypothetical protein
VVAQEQENFARKRWRLVMPVNGLRHAKRQAWR